jgi:MtN3 and saliva related transmembrane protein
MEIEKIVGIAAGVFTAASLLPQVIKTIKKKSADDVSIGMLALLFIGLCLWVAYGWIRQDWPVLVTNLFSLLTNSILIILRTIYKHK